MKPGEIILNGVSSEKLGFRVQYRPDIASPTRRLEFISTPGYSGSLIYDDNTFEDTPFELSLIIKGNGSDDHSAIMDKIWDVYSYFDTGKYIPMIPWFDERKEYLVIPDGGKGPTFSNNVYMDGNIVASIGLLCKPYKYIVGYAEQTPTSMNFTLKSPDRTHGGAPLIILEGTSINKSTVTVNGKAFELSSITDNSYIDSEKRMCYSLIGGSYKNRNSTVLTREYPILKPGNNTIAVSAPGITRVKITPRWRTRI